MQSAPNGPFLVLRHDDGYGDVHPLEVGQRYTLGRANTSRIVLKDELASREHAEVSFSEGHWRLRDLKSLNGTRVRGETLSPDGEWELSPADEFQIGRTNIVFVEEFNQLPEIGSPAPADSLQIRKRLGNTRFLTPLPPAGEEDTTTVGGKTTATRSLSRDLSLLYRLAFDMGSATVFEDLARVVLDGLLESIPAADVGAILTLKEGRNLEVTVNRHRDPSLRFYSPVSEFVSHEVLQSREAVLAEDVARDRYLRHRESLTHLGATSLICAPIIVGPKVHGLIHLYGTDPHKVLNAEDLEFVVAVSKQLAIAVGQLMRQESLQEENAQLRTQLGVESELVGSSQSIAHIHEQISRVASTNATVLVRGESGSGKELIARAIHYSSPRKAGPFVCLNCAAITETLLESELFGHEKGAFTGATEKKVGKFEAANRGTIFLDEIGEMAVNTQAKLLRVLEGHPFERVGGGTLIKTDVRVVAATNQPLEKLIAEGKFRRDLFFRLQVVEIQAPPLRERRDDIPILANHFLQRFVREAGRRIRGFSPAALKKMEAYDWPGNVRELRNAVERAVALSKGQVLEPSDIWLSSLELATGSAIHPAYEPVTLEEIEKRHILATLEHTEWNKSQAAAILAIERSTLDRKIKSYQLNRDENRP
ncbi:MAG: sigma 54-interacting transcriptional regulator [Gemmataceae bacterium]